MRHGSWMKMDDVVLQMWCAVLVSSVFSSFFSIDFIILGHGKCYWNLDCISLNFFLFVYLLLFQKKIMMFAHTWIQLSSLSVLLAQQQWPAFIKKYSSRALIEKQWEGIVPITFNVWNDEIVLSFSMRGFLSLPPCLSLASFNRKTICCDS